MDQDITKDALATHISNSYFFQRIGVGVFTLIFPFVLMCIGEGLYPPETPPTLSDHYHLGGFARDYFVATMASVGTFLILYQGFDNAEEWTLNFAGFCALGVAFIPAGSGVIDCIRFGNGANQQISLHGLAAGGLFLSLAWSAIRHTPHSLLFLPNTPLLQPIFRGKSLQWLFQQVYYLIGSAMVIVPILVFFTTRENTAHIAWFETAGIVVFALYWLTKGCEFRISHADQHRPKAVGLPKLLEQLRQKYRPHPSHNKSLLEHQSDTY